MSIPLWIVDAFTDRPFAGNPAAVCLLPAPRPDRWMQQVAAEMNLSETAFLVAREDGFSLRWFTPAVEVDLCGHATLASAHTLWQRGLLAADQPARFHTRSGLLTACKEGDHRIRLDFPAKPLEPCPPPEGLLEALGVQAVFVGRNQFDYLVEVVSEEEVRLAKPDFARLQTLPCRGVIFTARGTSGFDFVSRFFAPGAGVAEDPVTGSSHCALGPFWGARLGKTELQGFQVSPRGGMVGVRLVGDRVHLLGQAVTMLRGELAGVG
jgi:PhzF family phenazine biosynthesis protein